MIRLVAAGFAVLFTLVVAMGYVPAFVAAMAAAATSTRASLLFLTGFGWYYALDAAFSLTYGVLSGQAPMANLMLNAPHIAIATVMLGLVYWWVPRAGRPAVAY